MFIQLVVMQIWYKISGQKIEWSLLILFSVQKGDPFQGSKWGSYLAWEMVPEEACCIKPGLYWEEARWRAVDKGNGKTSNAWPSGFRSFWLRILLLFYVLLSQDGCQWEDSGWLERQDGILCPFLNASSWWLISSCFLSRILLSLK